VVAGTLSFDLARWNHARSGQILVSANWSDEAKNVDFRGTTTQGGVAGHGTSSPFDIHNTLIVAGPDFREHASSDVPTGNVDIAPTLLHMLGLPAPPTMAGRVIRESLRSGPAPSSIRVSRVNETVRTPDGAYELTAHISEAAGHRYLDSTLVRRSKRD
jgi:arylsulfatase A-like enzyme